MAVQKRRKRLDYRVKCEENIGKSETKSCIEESKEYFQNSKEYKSSFRL